MLLRVVGAREVIVRTRISREPVLILEVFAEGFKHGEGKFRSVAGNFADKFSKAFYDHKILFVHPDYAVE